MLHWIKNNSTSFFMAVVLHVIVLAALFFNWQAEKQKKIVLQQGDIIEVNTIDANRYTAEIRKIAAQKAAEKRRIQEAERKLREQQRQQTLRKQQAEHRARVARQAEQKRLAEKKQRQAQAKKKHQEEQKRKEAEAREIKEKKAAEKKAADAKRKKAQARAKEQARLKKEQQRKAAAEKARVEKAKQAKHKAAAEQKRQAELKREQQRQQAERARRNKGLIDRHAKLIVQKIERSWRQPLNVPAGLSCKIEIKLATSGKVLGVNVIESSGDVIFDQSVETAVLKASPLPVPIDSEIFQQFKIMILNFTPGSY